MRSTTLIATAALALTLTSAAHAQWNRYPDRGRSGSVSELAYEIEATATSIYREAARNNRRPDRDEARVLSNLRTLEARAREFRSEVRDGRWDDRRYDRYDRYDRRDNRRDNRRDYRDDARDYDRLADAFYATAESLRYIENRPYIDRGMDRIYHLLGEVSRYYGGNDRWGWEDRRGWRDRGRYDRDGRWRN